MKPFTTFNLTFIACLGLGLMSVVEGFEFFGGGLPGYDLSLGKKPAGLKTVKKRKYFDWWFHNSRGHPLVYCQARSAPPKDEVYGCLYKEYEEFGIKLWFCGASRSSTGASYTDHDVYTAAHKVCEAVPSLAEDKISPIP